MAHSPHYRARIEKFQRQNSLIKALKKISNLNHVFKPILVPLGVGMLQLYYKEGYKEPKVHIKIDEWLQKMKWICRKLPSEFA